MLWMQTTPSEQHLLAALSHCFPVHAHGQDCSCHVWLQHPRLEVKIGYANDHIRISCRCTYFAPGMEPSRSGKPTQCAKGAVCACACCDASLELGRV